MSVRAFVPVLREVEGALASPVPSRIRILQELEADLEDLRKRFEKEGANADEARRMAIEALVPDAATLADLDRLHTPWYRRVTARVSPEGLRRIERGALAAASLALLVGEIVMLKNVSLLEDASPFLWPVLAMGAVVFGWVATQVFRVWVKGDLRDPTRGIHTILLLSTATLLGAFVAVGVDFYLAALTIQQSPELVAPVAIRWLVSDATLLAVALGIFLAGGLSWLVLSQWWASISSARHDLLDIRSTTL